MTEWAYFNYRRPVFKVGQENCNNLKTNYYYKWHQEQRLEEEEKESPLEANPEPRDSSPERLSATPSSESPNQLSAESQKEMESKETPAKPTRRPALSLKASSRT